MEEEQNIERNFRLEKTLDMAGRLGHPESITEIKRDIILLTALNIPLKERKSLPPNHILHIGQVSTLTGVMLIDQTEEIQLRGQRLALTHDIGRSVDTGVNHIITGRKILEKLDFDKRTVVFAVAHHRWGLSKPLFGNRDPMVERVKVALERGNTRKLLDAIVNEWGIESLVVLLADNSKEPFVAQGVPQMIIPFNEKLGLELIQSQIDRGVYKAGSKTHEAEIIGMRFLCETVPYLEEKIKIKYYPNSIIKAREIWLKEERELIAIWRDILYHEVHEAPNR